MSVTGPDKETEELLEELHNEFNVNIMTEEVKSFLGMKILSNEEGLKIT